MATVTVPLAAARDRRLPAVSVRSGRSADGYVPVAVATGSLGIGWVLVLLGPPGWLLLALTSDWFRDEVTVHLPHTEREFRRRHRVERARRDGIVGTVAGAAAGLALSRTPGLLVVGLAITCVSAALWVAASWARGALTPDLRLDGERLILAGVHEDFVAAVGRAGLARR
ncbi:MAG: hypothetical protein D6683_09085 [Actinomyces sp.]|nr:MAG: hypothetical protein D6683_09085 [Actinomyces sp.]